MSGLLPGPGGRVATRDLIARARHVAGTPVAPAPTADPVSPAEPRTGEGHVDVAAVSVYASVVLLRDLAVDRIEVLVDSAAVDWLDVDDRTDVRTRVGRGMTDAAWLAADVASGRVLTEQAIAFLQVAGERTPEPVRTGEHRELGDLVTVLALVIASAVRGGREPDAAVEEVLSWFVAYQTGLLRWMPTAREPRALATGTTGALRTAVSGFLACPGAWDGWRRGTADHDGLEERVEVAWWVVGVLAAQRMMQAYESLVAVLVDR